MIIYNLLQGVTAAVFFPDRLPCSDRASGGDWPGLSVEMFSAMKQVPVRG